jgi:hypothetical protein
MIGDQLINAEGEELGMIQELLIDPEEGTVAFAVVSFEGVLGQDSALFVIPWRTLQPWPERHRFVFDIEKSNLLKALASESGSLLCDDSWRWVTNGRESFGYKRYSN